METETLLQEFFKLSGKSPRELERKQNAFFLETISSTRAERDGEMLERIEKLYYKDYCTNPAHGHENHPCENTTIRNKILDDVRCLFEPVSEENKGV